MISWKAFPEVPFKVKCINPSDCLIKGMEYTVYEVEDPTDKGMALFKLQEISEENNEWFAERFEPVDNEEAFTPAVALAVNDQGGVKADSGNLSVKFTFDSETFTKDFSEWVGNNINDLLERFQKQVDLGNYVVMEKLK
jgi:hypothetical protein